MDGGHEYRLRMQVRWRDIDRLGHLNQSVYHEFLEEARAGLMTDLVRRFGGGERGAWVVVRVELDYRAEVRKDHGEVDVVARIGHVGTTSIRVDHEIVLPDGTIAATGSTVLVAWDREARGKRAVTDAERAALLTVGPAPTMATKPAA
jgi:acyl-CoA thioester hydrolase